MSLIVWQYCLYIPLCFLLIMEFWGKLNRKYFLYIPLCFLLIDYHHLNIQFSYHLYIPLCFLLIEMWTSGFWRKLTLHSTMFSINRQNEQSRIYIRCLYIPLCFLLIAITAMTSIFGERLYIPLCFLLI